MIYTLNLVVNAKNVDIYDKVALNKYPYIIICMNQEELKRKLNSEPVITHIKSIIKSKKVYDSAKWMVRGLDDFDNISEFVLDVSDITPITFDLT
jgi:hypothetical protein